MYNWRKLAAHELQAALEMFEKTNTFELDEYAMDKIWDVTLRVSDNNRIKRRLGAYYHHYNRIEIYPHMFRNNPLKFADTVRHEVAHHIAGIIYGAMEGHGQGWKHCCRLVGAVAETTACIKTWEHRLITTNRDFSEYLIA